MSKKYELTDETVTLADGTVLHRIRALRNVGMDVVAGVYGGCIEREKNLSQDGSAWVYYGAKVYGFAQVYGDAIVCGEARVHDHAMVKDHAEVRAHAEVRHFARVYDHAVVDDYARVQQDACVYGHAFMGGNAQACHTVEVCGDAASRGHAIINRMTDYLTIGPIGSRNMTTTFYREGAGIGVACGCFTGSLDEFRERVVLTHGDNQHARDYLAAAELAKIKLGIGGRKP